MTELKYDEFTNCLCYDNDNNFLKWRILFPPKLHKNKLSHHNNHDLNASLPTNSASSSSHKRKSRSHRHAFRYKTQPITFDEIIEADEETLSDINNNNTGNLRGSYTSGNNNIDSLNNINYSSISKTNQRSSIKKCFPPFTNRCSMDFHLRSNLSNDIREGDEAEVVAAETVKMEITGEELTEIEKAERVRAENAEELENAWKRRRSLRLLRNSVMEEEVNEVEGC